MKKIYVHLLWIMSSVSLLCMEQQKPPLFVAHDDRTIITSHHDIHPPLFSMHNEANQPGWEKLNDIASMTYNTPIYQQIGTLRYATAQQELQQTEKKILLKTNSAQRDINTLKEAIYGYVDMLDQSSKVSKHEWRHLNNIFNYSTLCEQHHRSNPGYRLGRLINIMRAAKEEEGITEDMMGSYTYHKDSSGIFQELSHKKAFIFSVLKKYIHMTSIIPEQLPFDENQDIIIIPIDFLGVTPAHDKGNLMHTKYSVIYPAFADLAHNIYYAFEAQRCAVVNAVVSCFYSSDYKNQKSNEYRTLTNFIGLNDFYKRAYEVISTSSSHEQIYDLLQLIEGTRGSTIESYEDKLIQQMHNFNPSKVTLIFNPSYWEGDCFSDMTKKYVCQVFALIKQYNKRRQYRVTPTPEQYRAYNMICILALPLPDAWNSNMFDPEQYAFTEFFYLMGAINQLKNFFDNAQKKTI